MATSAPGATTEESPAPVGVVSGIGQPHLSRQDLATLVSGARASYMSGYRVRGAEIVSGGLGTLRHRTGKWRCRARPACSVCGA